MQVFKLYFKIIKKNIPMLVIYFIVFVGMSIVYSTSGQSNELIDFTESKCPVALINNDTGSALASGLISYIGQKSNVVSIEDDKESLQDALFFRKVEYIIRIPAGFANDFMSGGRAALEETSVPNSTSGLYMEMLINKYLNLARHYVKYQEGITQEELAIKVAGNLSEVTAVRIKKFESKVSNGSGISYHFNFASYPVTIILILGITSFMLVFNDTLQKRRTLCSPLSQSRYGFETLLANLVFTAIVWVVFIIISFALHSSRLFSINGLLWAINLFCISIVGLSISFLAGNLIKSKNVQSAVANVLGLGLAFLSGSFVPQSLLSESVLSVARFLPTYWYVRASDTIGSLKSFGWNSLEPVIYSFLIQLGFAAALISVSLVFSRQKRLNTL